jgi:hypothetical protein
MAAKDLSLSALLMSGWKHRAGKGNLLANGDKMRANGSRSRPGQRALGFWLDVSFQRSGAFASRLFSNAPSLHGAVKFTLFSLLDGSDHPCNA